MSVQNSETAMIASDDQAGATIGEPQTSGAVRIRVLIDDPDEDMLDVYREFPREDFDVVTVLTAISM